MKVPTVYLDIAERLRRNCETENKISVKRARRILGGVYHFKKINLPSIISELEKYGLISYNPYGIIIKFQLIELSQ